MQVGDGEAEDLVVTRRRGVLANDPPSNLPMPASAVGPQRCRMKKQVITQMKGFSRKQAAKGAPVFAAVLLIACAGSLAGCAASLNSEMQAGSLISGIQTGFVQQEQLVHKEPKTSSKPAMRMQLSAKSEPTPVRFSSTAERPSSITTSGNTAYKIGAQDILEISVFKVPELSRSVQVADAGSVNLPLLGEVRAAGKTPQEVERDLKSKLGAKYLESPQVTVIVKEYNSQRVTLVGAVTKPGIYPVRGKTTLLQFIAMAGGIDAGVASSDVAVFRHVDGKRYLAAFDIDQIRDGQAEDPAIHSGDVIVVNTSGIKNAYKNLMKAMPITSLLWFVL
jgi:polysaccharide export outer membrane protein